MSKLRILYVSSEVDPFLNTSKIADFVRALPTAMQERGMEIRIFGGLSKAPVHMYATLHDFGPARSRINRNIERMLSMNMSMLPYMHR